MWNVQPSSVSPVFGQEGAFAPGRTGFGIAKVTSGVTGVWEAPLLVQPAQTATNDINTQRMTFCSLADDATEYDVPVDARVAMTIAGSG